MDYTLHQLQIFLKVAQLGSITKAAEELYLTQPAVSIQLKKFQQQFNIPLTEIIGRQVYITDFGREIARAAESILNEVYAINYKTLAYKGKLTGRLRISVVSTGKYVMPFFLTDFLQRNEGIELVLDVTNKAKVLESMEKNEVDFALVSILPESLPVEKLQLLQNKLYLVAGPEHEVPRKPIDKKKLESMPMIYREFGSGTRITMEKFFEQSSLKVTKRLELTSNEAVKQAVIAGLGVSIMPLIGLYNELMNRQVNIIPVKGLPITSNWNLIWLKQKKLSPVAQAYLDFLSKEKEAIIRQKFDWYLNY